ncbi:MAG: HAD-IA family hydrolase [Gemmatimonadota bacterium]
MSSRVRAVIWDFDNTLVDSRERNLAVTRRIVGRVLGRWDGCSMLSSLESYEAALWRTENWRDMYRVELGMDEEAVDEAGRLWTECQISETTQATIFPGVRKALQELRHLPNGIVSANSRRNIRETLRAQELDGHFEAVIGFEEVPLRAQKPAPDGFLLCAERLNALKLGVLVYVGDHEADAKCAQNVNAELERRGVDVRVISVGADYGRDGAEWSVEPDHLASSPEDVVRVVAAIEGRRMD